MKKSTKKPMPKGMPPKGMPPADMPMDMILMMAAKKKRGNKNGKK